MLRGDRLRQLREGKALTQDELAELLNVSVGQIWRYEAQKTKPTGDIIARMAEVFNVTTDYLLGRSDDPMPYLKIDNLTAHERKVLLAMRWGAVVEAIKEIVASV